MPPPTAKQRALLALAPPLASLSLRALAATWRLRETGESGLSARLGQPQPRIYAYWHECVLPAVGAYRDLGIHPFASRSFDGELISRAMTRLGFGETARGSSSRGGATGLLELMGFLEKGGHVAVTVDGPRGPRRKAQEGVVKLAQLSGFSIVPFHIQASPSLRLRSWDRMLLPLPFMALDVRFGPAIAIARNLSSLEGPLAQLQASLEALSKAD